MLEGKYKGSEDVEDGVYFFVKHVQKSFGIDLYSFFDDNDQFMDSDFMLKFTTHHKRNRPMWPWNKAAMSIKLRYAIIIYLYIFLLFI